MRVSMSKKIYFAVTVLVLVGLVLVGVALWSINTLLLNSESLSRRGNRAIILALMDSVLLNRQIGMNSIIASSDTAEMQRLSDGIAPGVEQMNAHIDNYARNMPLNPDEATRARPETLRKQWADLVRVTLDVIALGMENTNVQAIRLNDANQAFWEKADGDLEALANFFNSRNDPEHAGQARGLRNSLSLTRLNLVKFMTAVTLAERKQYEEGTLRFVQEIDGALAELARTLPADGGGRQTQEIADALTKTGTPLIAELMRLINRDSNGLARAARANTIFLIFL